MINSLVLALLGGISFLFLTACTPFTADFGSSSPAAKEPEYKGTPTDYSGTNPIYIKVLAQYKYRELAFNTAQLSAAGLRNTFGTRGIPHCEFHIYDAAGNRIQQGETDVDGYALFAIPRTQGTYSLKVYSRALNDYIKVSVLADIYSNEPYAITKNFTLNSGNINSGTTSGSPYTGFSSFAAEADEALSPNIEGGAFNILYDIYLANEYIRTQTSRTTLVTNWWVANKVTAYWKAGFNPYTYISSGSTSGVSFYSQGTDNLFILGGISGNVRTADTDHFDDSVILHEYGHFLEDNYGNSQSPGGSHNGSFIIDARLAWSEGWANYFQAAVLSQTADVPATERLKYYIDTQGYKTSDGDTSGKLSIYFNLAAAAAGNIYDPISQITTPDREGNFREVSISRTLYKSTRDSAQNYTGTKAGGGMSFLNIWKTFSGELGASAQSLKNTAAFPLPSMGAFNLSLDANTTGMNKTNWNAVLTEEKQAKDLLEFGQIVTTQVAQCPRTISGVADGTLGGYYKSNQLQNNDFFLYYHNGGSSTINLLATQTAAPSVASYQMDLDLYVYYLSYAYFEEEFIDAGYTSQYLAKSKRTPASTSMNESISMAGLPAGYYVINVKLNSIDKTNGAKKATSALDGTVTYDLKIGSNFLCP